MPLSVIAQLLGNILASLLGGSALDGVTEWKKAKAARKRVLHCGLRVASGSEAGLGEHWLFGEWTVRPGRLTLGVLTIRVSETVKGSRRPAQFKLAGDPGDVVIVSVRTTTAVLEWALLRRSDGLALRALDVPSSGVRPDS